MYRKYSYLVSYYCILSIIVMVNATISQTTTGTNISNMLDIFLCSFIDEQHVSKIPIIIYLTITQHNNARRTGLECTTQIIDSALSLIRIYIYLQGD